MPSESSRDRLPFEPRQKKPKSSTKSPATNQNTVVESPKKTDKSEVSLSAIPDAVSKRMIRRMALFSGIPTLLGIATFFAAYIIVTQKLYPLPTIAVVFVSMGFFGLGVIGLTYGILSTSWDEDRIGTWFGWSEFRLNFDRMTSAWRSARREVKSQKS